jgi:hypothetical protein
MSKFMRTTFYTVYKKNYSVSNSIAFKNINKGFSWSVIIRALFIINNVIHAVFHLTKARLQHLWGLTSLIVVRQGFTCDIIIMLSHHTHYFSSHHQFKCHSNMPPTLIQAQLHRGVRDRFTRFYLTSAAEALERYIHVNSSATVRFSGHNNHDGQQKDHNFWLS